MEETSFDFMKIWTQGDYESERKMRGALLEGMDVIVQDQSDVLSRIEVLGPATGPVVRWMEEWGYPSTVTAQLMESSLVFSGNLFGKTVTPETLRQVIRSGTILERPGDGCQVKVSSVDGSSASVTPYGNSRLSNDPEPVGWDIISEVWSDSWDASRSP